MQHVFSSRRVSHDAWCQDIIRLPKLFRPLQKPLAKFISVVRAPKSKEGYASIGGGFPLRQITDAQVQFYVLLFHLLSDRAAMP
jgi:protoheme ferro-lyase